MAIVVIGVNHRTAPLAVLERVTLNSDARPKALRDLCLRPNLSEVVLLSTCNRTEVYAVTERFHGAYADIRDFFCSLAGLSPGTLSLHLISQHDEEAATHLFEVAAGLRSAVLGESEVLGQVRGAWMLGQRRGTRARSTCCSVAPSRSASAPGPPSGEAASVSRPSRWPRSASARWAPRRSSWSAPATWARAPPSRSRPAVWASSSS